MDKVQYIRYFSNLSNSIRTIFIINKFKSNKMKHQPQENYYHSSQYIKIKTQLHPSNGYRPVVDQLSPNE